jgi:excisionase family DNA binding protein
MSGLGRTKIYEALGAGDLSSIKIGSRRLILVDDLRDWLARHRQGSR